MKITKVYHDKVYNKLGAIAHKLDEDRYYADYNREAYEAQQAYFNSIREEEEEVERWIQEEYIGDEQYENRDLELVDECGDWKTNLDNEQLDEKNG